MNELAPLCVVGVYAGIFGAAMLAGHLVRKSRHEQLRLLARKLENGRARVPSGLFASMEDASVDGVLGGLHVRLGFDVRGSGKHKRTYALYRVKVPHGVGRVVAHPADVLTRFARWLGLGSSEVTGDPDLDRRFSFSGERAALRRLHRGEGQGAALSGGLQRAFDRAGLTRIELHRDRIEAEQQAPWDAVAYERALRTLVDLGRLWARQPVEIKLRGSVTVKPHLAWTAGGTRPLCPYCRDELGDDGEALLACERCDTLHHAACLAEAGGCTVFGCAGRGERGTARQPIR